MWVKTGGGLGWVGGVSGSVTCHDEDLDGGKDGERAPGEGVAEVRLLGLDGGVGPGDAGDHLGAGGASHAEHRPAAVHDLSLLEAVVGGGGGYDMMEGGRVRKRKKKHVVEIDGCWFFRFFLVFPPPAFSLSPSRTHLQAREGKKKYPNTGCEGGARRRR